MKVVDNITVKAATAGMGKAWHVFYDDGEGVYIRSGMIKVFTTARQVLEDAKECAEQGKEVSGI